MADVVRAGQIWLGYLRAGFDASWKLLAHSDFTPVFFVVGYAAWVCWVFSW